MLIQIKFCHNAANIFVGMQLPNVLRSPYIKYLTPVTNHNNLISYIMGSDVLRELCKAQDGTVDVRSP
jgi:hypothetical protein